MRGNLERSLISSSWSPLCGMRVQSGGDVWKFLVTHLTLRSGWKFTKCINMIDGTFFPPSKLTRADFHSWAFNPLTSNQICHINDADALKLCICSSEHALPRFYSMRDIVRWKRIQCRSVILSPRICIYRLMLNNWFFCAILLFFCLFLVFCLKYFI